MTRLHAAPRTDAPAEHGGAERPVNSAELLTVEIPSARHQRRSLVPRFGLRTLLILGIVFCLLFGWIGRNLHRVHQEDAAIEAILKADGEITLAAASDASSVEVWMSVPDDVSFVARLTDQTLRSVGLRRRLPIEAVDIYAMEAQDAASLKALAALRDLPEVESVSLTGSGIDDSAISALDDLPALTRLSLSDTSITGPGLAKFREPERLLTLEIRSYADSRGILSNVRSLANLRTLLVQDSRISHSEIEAIAALQNLQRLELCDVKTHGEQTLAPLAGHTRLANLRLSDWTLDEKETATLASLPALRTLWIDGAKDEDLPSLARLRGLHTLYLSSHVTHAGARRLSAECPDLNVILWTTGWTVARFRGGSDLSESSQP